MQENVLDLDQQRKGRMVLLLLVIFFVVPIIAVLLMLRFHWTPQGESFGELVRPPREITMPKVANDASAIAVSPLLWKEKWSIVYISADCQAACMAKLQDMRQVHASLYKDVVRVQRVLITNSADMTEIKKRFPDLIVIHQPQETVAHLRAQFQTPAENMGDTNQLYLVDPLGFYMMNYASNTPLADVRRDIVRLLKSSWAG